MSVPASRSVCAAILAGMLIATGCASGRSTPRPFPGATLPRPEPDRVDTAARPELVATALTFLGTPYRNGGSDPSGFDCSGFVQWVFARHGTALPREVKDQFDAGREIDRDELQPGDLVFFETVSRGASHVGIALGGDEFVHAPSSRGVIRVERFTSPYWADRWKGARRVAN